MPDPTVTRRIAVLGRAGSGKTTASLILGDALGIQVVHLDQLYWTREWEPVGEARFEELHKAATAGQAWILDGGYMSLPSFVDRVRRSDLIVITRAPLAVCLYRVVRRTFRHRGKARADRPTSAEEAFSPTFLAWILRWSWIHRHLPDEIASLVPGTRIAVVRGLSDLQVLVRLLE